MEQKLFTLVVFGTKITKLILGNNHDLDKRTGLRRLWEVRHSTIHHVTSSFLPVKLKIIISCLNKHLCRLFVRTPHVIQVGVDGWFNKRGTSPQETRVWVQWETSNLKHHFDERHAKLRKYSFYRQTWDLDLICYISSHFGARCLLLYVEFSHLQYFTKWNLYTFNTHLQYHSVRPFLQYY